MAKIINGKEVAASVKAQVAEETAKLKEEKGLKVGLAVVIVQQPCIKSLCKLKEKGLRRSRISVL